MTTGSIDSARVGSRGGRGRLRPGAERLEGRAVPSGLAFHFTLVDPGGQFAPYPGLLPALQAAGDHLSSLIDGKGSIEVAVNPINQPGNLLAQNQFTSSSSTTVHTTTGADGQSTTTVDTPGEMFQGLHLSTILPLQEAQTGVDPNGDAPDLTIAVNLANLGSAWFDTSGAARTAPVPADKLDFEGVFLHEMLHGLGFAGGLTATTTKPSGVPGVPPVTFPGTINNFTRFTTQGVAGISPGEGFGQPDFFDGPHVEAVHGSPVPVISDGHVGGPSGPLDLMNPSTMNGTRFPISDIDLAILADMGWSILRYPHNPSVSGSGTDSTTSPTSGPGPTVTSAVPASGRSSVTGVVLTFRGALDLARASDPTLYSVRRPGRSAGHHHAASGRPVAVTRASYDPTTDRVTLALGPGLRPGQVFQLRIRSAPSGLSDPSGVLLNSPGGTAPGTDYVVSLVAPKAARIKRA